MATALIAGATGLVGRHLIDLLVAAPEYERVIAVTRRPLEVEHPKLVAVIVGFSALDRLGESLQADDAFCCLGTTMQKAGSREAFRAVDHSAVLAFAWAAQRGGARRLFTVSAMGANAVSRVFYHRVKGETEEALQVLGFDTLGLFRPGLLRGKRDEYRFGERLAHVALAVAEPLLIGRLRKYRAVHAAAVARAMLRASFGTGARGTLVFESDEIQDLGRANLGRATAAGRAD